MIPLIHQSDFEAEVLQSPIPVIVDYGSATCGKCKMLSPTIDQIAAEFAGVAKVVKVSVDTDMPLAQLYKVTMLPTLHFFKGGELRHTIINIATKETIVSHLRELL